jgi:hypothetical protein
VRQLAALPLLLCACAQPWSVGSTVQPATAPYSPEVSGEDRSDHACTVVLREVARVPNGTGGYEVNEVDGQRWIVWEGWLDVAWDAVESGAAPAVIFRDPAGSWWEVEATEAEGAPAGYRRYGFRLDEQTVTEGMSISALDAALLELVPLVRTAEGDRLFDHNRNHGDFDNYVLSSDNAWSVEDDGAACQPAEEPPWAALELRGDWEELQHGAIVPGGALWVEYDISRMPHCFGSTTMGQADWNTWAYGRFEPSGESFAASVVDCDDAACTIPRSLPVEVEVPADATGVQLWFNSAGRSCGSHWDSNYGANYGFGTDASPLDPAWAGNTGYTLSRGMDLRVEEIPERLLIDSWVITRADRRSLDAEVYVPGLTDGSEREELILAEARVSRDGAEAARHWMEGQGRVGNNLRFAWDIADEDLIYTPWDELEVVLAFSTDGLVWTELGPYVLERDESWCPEYYWGAEWCP